MQQLIFCHHHTTIESIVPIFFVYAKEEPWHWNAWRGHIIIILLTIFYVFSPPSSSKRSFYLLGTNFRDKMQIVLLMYMCAIWKKSAIRSTRNFLQFGELFDNDVLTWNRYGKKWLEYFSWKKIVIIRRILALFGCVKIRGIFLNS